ncbi:penicillin-insensitive murein endopeptidase [Methylobrevis pamukkalensis]|uniref:Penicillin-insensitive murein endopeptidase n=1 Tax=Methylobrevis pamukkalensis TaxID=1439726 RepID=A0A1E3H2F0_9HYPH|nr:penicillin-insensitive murein endopeptidase [Methylobrevis pamukkalensis]ODN70503.1 Penicillin-insensitive murein endopeptidase precursor [Methylobrevis pamukkalensis]
MVPRPILLLGALLMLVSLGLPGTAAAAETPAKELFGAKDTPAPLAARAIGSYARGCLAGAVALPVNGPGWQVMRLSRNRFWGHPNLIATLERLAAKAPDLGWRGLMVGDMAQPRGGPMLTGHSSHQIGLDADIWLQPTPDHLMTNRERENVSAVSMLDRNGKTVDPRKFTPVHAALIRASAKDRAVARIFVNPAIKKALCEGAGRDRAWLSKVRPWYGHDYHFHIRIDCPRGSSGCKDQAAPPPGDGCGKELAWWLSDAPYAKPDKPKKPAPPPRPVTLKDLPPACSEVLVAR